VQPAKPAASGRQRIESDESEYDSEMDDFIDDTEANVDISKEIRSIFG
jgi:protein SPT2